MKIAIVDDDPQLRSLLARVIRCWGHDVCVEAADGVEALSLLSTFPADLIVTDCQMPNLDGIGLARALRSRADLRPIVMLSAQTDPSLIQSALRAGVTHYLTKPLNIPQFLHTLRDLTLRDAA